MAKRSKVELYGLLEEVVRLYEKEKLSIKEIEDRLRAEGYDVSCSGIHRSLKNYKEVAAQYKQSLEEAKLLIEAVKNSPNTDVLETTTSLLAHRLFEFAKELEFVEFEDPAKFADVLAKISHTQVAMGRLRLEYQKGFEQAKEVILKEIGQILADDEELQKRILDKIRQINLK